MCCAMCSSIIGGDGLGKEHFAFCFDNCKRSYCKHCVDNFEKRIQQIDYISLAKELALQKGKDAVISKILDGAVAKAFGAVVPGASAAIMMHYNGISAALNGDGKGVIKAATGGFGSLSGAVVGTAIFPGLGTFIGGLIGAGIGWLGGYGACKLVK